MSRDGNLKPVGLFGNRFNAVQRQAKIDLNSRGSLFDLTARLNARLVWAEDDD